MTDPRTAPRRPRGITIIPIIGDLVAMARLLRDRGAPTWSKLLVAATILYVVCPVDAIPDVAPFVGWLDDVGLVIAMRLILHSRLEPYRYRLFDRREQPAAAAAPA